MTPILAATRVEVEDMGHFLLVGFADDAASDYLMLQRAFEDEEQDRTLGMDTYHVERADQGNSCYGGISRLTMHGERVEIEFDANGRKAMDGATQLQVRFVIDQNRYDRLVAGLERIFEGTDCLRIAMP